MNLTAITQFVGLLAAMSVATERAVEVIKGMVPYLNQQLPPGASNSRRAALIQVISIACGAVISISVQGQVPAGVSAKEIGFWSYLVLGLLTSGGSALWNHVLDIIGAFKVQKEKLAALQPAAPAAK